MKSLIIILSCLIIINPGLDANAHDLSDNELSRILAGEIIVKSVNDTKGTPGIIAAFSTTASKEKIWGILVDYQNYINVFDGIDKLEVIREDEHGAVVKFWVDAVLAELNYTLYRKHDKTLYTLSWEKIDGDLEKISGSWQIKDSPVPGIRIVVYSSFVEVGRIVPAGLIRWGARQKADEMCQKLIKLFSATG